MNPLFTLLWGNQAQTAAAVAVLTETDWVEVDRLAGQHRLRPLLYHRALTGAWPCPPQWLERWRITHHRSGLRALQQRGELRRIGKAFEDQGIAAIALKGGALVWSEGCDPALRPLRDLDLLLAPNDAERAASVLAAMGFATSAVAMAEDAKHLPPMVRGTVAVELHLRLLEISDPAAAKREAQFIAGVWRRAEPCPIAPGLLATAHSDTLLHLILHAILDHQFNNGPLVITDMAWLIGSGQVDWANFWSEAKALDAVRACQLTLGVGEALAGLPVEWLDNRPTDLSAAAIDRVTRLMLVEMDHRAAVGWPGKLARLPLRRWPGLLGQMVRRRRGRAVTTEPADTGRSWTSDLRTMLSPLGLENVSDAIGLSQWLRKGR